jgi:hypothetical protein
MMPEDGDLQTYQKGFVDMGSFIGIVKRRFVGVLGLRRCAFASFTEALGWVPIETRHLDRRENPVYQKVLRSFKPVDSKRDGRWCG